MAELEFSQIPQFGEFDTEAYESEIKESEDEFADLIEERRFKLAEAFKERKRDQGFEVDHIDFGFTSPLKRPLSVLEYDNKAEKEISKFYSKQNSDYNTWREFDAYYKKKERKRFQKISPEAKQLELSFGGVYRKSAAQMNIESFVEGGLEGLSLDIANYDDEIYGKAIKSRHSRAYGFGKMVGNIVAYMTLAKMGGPFVASALKKTLPANAFKAAGWAKYGIGKMGRLTPFFEKGTELVKAGKWVFPKKLAGYSLGVTKKEAWRYATRGIAGEIGLTNGVIGSLMNGVSQSARNLREQDKLSLKKWATSMPKAMMEGFFKRYFIGVINDPAWWPARFLGDAVYSGGEQLYSIVTGEQDGWNWGRYLQSALEGHILGEVQGFTFGPTREQMNTLYASNKQRKYLTDLKGRLNEMGLTGVKDEQLFKQVSELAYVEDKFIQKQNRFLSEAEMKRAVDELADMTFEMFDVQFNADNANAYKVDRGKIDLLEKSLGNWMSYRTTKQALNLSNRQMIELIEKDALNDKTAFKEFLIKHNKFTKTTEEQEIIKTPGKPVTGWVKDPTKVEVELEELFTLKEYRESLKTNFKPYSKHELDKYIEEKYNMMTGKKFSDYDKASITKKDAEALESKGQKIVVRAKPIEDALHWAARDEAIKLYNSVNKFYNYASSKDVDGLDAIERSIRSVQATPAKRLLEGITKPLEEWLSDQKSKEYKIFLDNIIKDKGIAERALRNNVGSIVTSQKRKKVTLDKKQIVLAYMRAGYTEERAENTYKDLIKIEEKTDKVFEDDFMAEVGKEDTTGKPYSTVLKQNIDNNDPVNDAYKEFFDRKPSSFIAYYLNGKGASNDNIAKALGIDKTNVPRTVKRGKEEFIESVIKRRLRYRKIVKAGKPEVTAKRTKTILTKPSRTIIKKEFLLNDKQLSELVDRYNEEKIYINKTTGIEALIEKDDAEIFERDGGYVVSFDKIWNEINKSFGRKVADDLLYRAGNMINRYIDEYEERIGYNEKIILKNPVSNNSTKFILYGDGINPDKFVNSLLTIIRQNNYEDTKFAVMVDVSEGKHVIHNFKDVTAVKMNNIDKAVDLSKDIEYIKELAGQIAPNLVPNIDRSIFDERSIPKLNEIKVAMETGDIEAAKIGIQEIVDFTKKETTEIIMKDFKTMVDKQDKVVMSTAELTDNGENYFTQIMNAEKKFFEVAAFFKAFNWTKGATGIPKKIGGLLEKGEAKFNILKWVSDTFTNFGGKDTQAQARDFVIEINKLANVLNRSGINAEVLFKGITADFSSKYAGKKAKTAYDFFGKQQYEEESKILQTTKPKVLYEDIKWEKGSNIQKLLNTIVKDPNQITDEITATIKNATSDPLVLSKLLVQKFEVEPKDLIQLSRDIYFQFFKPLEDYLKENDDLNYDVFNRMKNDIQKVVSKHIEELNLDNYSKKDARIIINTKTTGQIKSKLVRAVDMYHRIKSENLSYIHHTIIANNEKKFRNIILDMINKGRLSGAEENAGTVMKEILKKRHFVTIREAVEAGFTVQRSWYENLYSTMKYAYSRIMNREAAEQMKNTFLQEWEINARNGTLDAFISDYTGGVFYVPTKEELSGMTSRIGKLKKILAEVANTGGDDAELVRLQKRITFEEKKKTTAEALKKWVTNSESIAARLLAGQTYLPGNYEAFVKDSGNMKFLKAGILKHTDGMRAANLKGYEGLYFHTDMWKAMKNLVFRNDATKYNYKYGWQEYGLKTYDKVSFELKHIRFYKPTIILYNNLQQASLMNPLFFKDIPDAWRIDNHRYDRVAPNDPNSDWTDDAKEYRIWDNLNLYNNGSGISENMNHAARAMADILDSPGVYKRIFENTAGLKDFFKTTLKEAGGAWKSYKQLTWKFDRVIRTAAARSIYRRFKNVYSEKDARYMAAHMTNMFLVEYDRIPQATKRVLNRILLVGNYRIGNLRMYGNMITRAIKGAQRIAGKEFDENTEMYKISDSKVKQGLFEMMPLGLYMLYRGGLAAMFGSLFGFNHSSVLDLITGYRVKKEDEKKSMMDRDIEYFSFGGPIFDLQKHYTRLTRAPMVWLKYNMNAFLGLSYSLKTNTNAITGRKVITVDHMKEPRKALGQFAMNLLTTYFPFGSDYNNMFNTDLEMTKKIINLFGVGYFYNSQSPNQLLREFNESLDKSKTIKEQARALKKFQYSFKRTYMNLMGKEYKDISEQIRKLREEK